MDNFSGNLRIELKVNKINEFDERIQLARQKIESCAERWSEGANENLQVVVANAFAVDKRGNFDNGQNPRAPGVEDKGQGVERGHGPHHRFTLFRWHPRISAFQVRDTPDAEWRTIRLDLAGV